MQINNPIQMNDWDIKKFLKVILTVQIAMWSVIYLDFMGIEIPIIRQAIGFIYLTFVPGIIILRILKLHKLGTIETLLYTIGLSISLLMFTGLLMNTVYPLFGISRPISITPLIITISTVVLVLCVMCYVRDKDFSDPSYIEVKDILSPPALFLCLIPFLSIFGRYLDDFYSNNMLLMFLIVIIALIVLLIAFDKFIPKELYPLAVLMITIAFLYNHSLISMYLPTWDIHQEYHLANLVMINSFWDSTISHTCNAMLSIVMLAPIYSILLNMDLTWIFKVVYPLLYSFMVLGLYYIFQKQTDDKTAFFACFFFTSICVFTEMVELARQEIAELFLVLLMLLMIDKKMVKAKRALLSIIFGFSMVVSHYGLSYIYMFCLVFAWLILLSMDNPTINKFWKTLYFRLGKVTNSITDLRDRELNRTIGINFVLLYVVFILTWYMYVSSSSAFNAIVGIGDHIASSIFTDFLNPEATQGLSILLTETISPLHEVSKFLHHATQFFIVVGVFKLVLRRKEMKFEDEYAVFSAMNLMILFACILVPYFSSALNTSRLYHISLVFLAPFCVIGGVTVFGTLSKAFKFVLHKLSKIRSTLRNNNYINLQTPIKFLSVFFVIFLLFNTGFIYQIAEDNPTSRLDTARMKRSNEITSLDLSGYIYDYDAFSAKWTSTTIKSKDKIYADYIANEMILISYGMQPRAYWHAHVLSNQTRIKKDSYIYLRRTNIVKGVIIGRGSTWNTTDILPPSKRIGVIYTNGGSEIYYYE